MTAAARPHPGDMPALTGIRGLAAWFVVLYHIRTSAGAQLPPELMAVLAKGYLAVDLFFMLSGFVLALNYQDRFRRDGVAAVPAFLARRVARIWPLHLTILAATVAYAALLAALGRGSIHYPWADLPFHLLLMQSWGLTDALRWNDPSWSISAEWAAYLLFPVLALAVDWRRLPVPLLLILLALIFAALGGGMTLGGAAILDHDISRLGLFRALCEFAAGTLLCGLWMQARAGARLPLLLIPLAPLPLLIGLSEVWAAPPLLAALLFTVALTAGARGNPLSWRFVHHLGEISYSTYLVHFLLWTWFKLVFVADHGGVAPWQAGAFLALVYAASVLLYRLVERPAQRALNAWFDARLNRVVRALPA